MPEIEKLRHTSILERIGLEGDSLVQNGERITVNPWLRKHKLFETPSAIKPNINGKEPFRRAVNRQRTVVGNRDRKITGLAISGSILMPSQLLFPTMNIAFFSAFLRRLMSLHTSHLFYSGISCICEEIG